MKKVFVLGSINYDLVICSERLPKQGETIFGFDFLSNSGGKGANQAVACSKLGADTYLIGAIGNDIYGKECLETIKKYGVNVDNVFVVDGNTGLAFINVVNGDNRIILNHGANYKLDTNKILEIIDKDVNEGDIFICQLEIPLVQVGKALNKAKAKGAITILNPAPSTLLNEDLLQNVDIIVPNEVELQNITSYKIKNISDMINSQKLLKKMGVKELVLTLGKNGYFYDETIYQPQKIDPVDTTCAGDTFIGALASQLSRGIQLKDALEFCQLASSFTIRRRGAQISIPTLKEIEDYKDLNR